MRDRAASPIQRPPRRGASLRPHPPMRITPAADASHRADIDGNVLPEAIHVESPTKLPITQIDVAREAGVHCSTVSLALRNSPLIAEATKRHIQGVAQRLGYCPDPALRALVAYRKRLGSVRTSETIAYVTNGLSPWAWQNVPAEKRIFMGAQEKAAQSGYKLEHFWIGEPGVSGRRLCSILFSRGIRGMLLATVRGCQHTDFHWDHLAAVHVGCGAKIDGLHSVTIDPASEIRKAMQHALAAGFQRIGVLLPRSWDEEADGRWSDGISAMPNDGLGPQTISVFMLEEFDDASRADTEPVHAISSSTALADWFYRYKPDVILGSYPLAAAAFSGIGIDLPSSLPFVELAHQTPSHEVPGIVLNFQHLGAVAVEILIGQLQLNLSGVPIFPTTTVVEGIWRPGDSLRPRRYAEMNA